MSHSLRGSVDWNFCVFCYVFGCYSHSLRGSVDWNIICVRCKGMRVVTPYAGVWIEICLTKQKRRGGTSLPTRECGLKYAKNCKRPRIHGHSLRGSVDWNCTANMELKQCICHSLRGSVDWNSYAHMLVSMGVVSLPTRECGLKLVISVLVLILFSHSLRGSVDWNHYLHYLN